MVNIKVRYERLRLKDRVEKWSRGDPEQERDDAAVKSLHHWPSNSRPRCTTDLCQNEVSFIWPTQQ